MTGRKVHGTKCAAGRRHVKKGREGDKNIQIYSPSFHKTPTRHAAAAPPRGSKRARLKSRGDIPILWLIIT